MYKPKENWNSQMLNINTTHFKILKIQVCCTNRDIITNFVCIVSSLISVFVIMVIILLSWSSSSLHYHHQCNYYGIRNEYD